MAFQGDPLKIYSEYRKYKEYYFGTFVITFEKLAKFLGSQLNLKPPTKKEEEFSRINKEIHLDLTFKDIYSTAVFFLVTIFVSGFLTSFIFGNLLFILFFLIVGLLVYNLVLVYPKLLYLKLQKKKESQLILATMFLAMKLRENPNLEIAFEYATKHIQPPLKLDFLRLLWDTYNKRYSSLLDALDIYIKSWEKRAYYFVMGIELLISSLYEPDSIRREIIIDKAIETTLEGLYEKMSMYVRELQSPINLIYMLGIVLPTLLLTLFPLMTVLMPDVFSPGMLFVVFNIAIPFFVYLMITQYIEPKRAETLPKEDLYFYLYMKKNDVKSKLYSIIAGTVVSVLVFFVLAFVVCGYIASYSILSIVLAGILILSLGLGIAAGHFAYYMYYREFKQRLENIEKELSSFLFSLGNKLNENIPLEAALIEIYPQFKNKDIGKFLAVVYRNLKVFGMSIDEAIFDKKRGALSRYPSSYLEAAMEVIVESAKVSPKSAAKAAIAISRYFIYLERIKLRLLDLTTEVTSQMKSLVKILAPSILGVIVATAIMSLVILYKLGIAISKIKGIYSGVSGEYASYAMLTESFLDIFSFKSMVSPPTIYIVVGVFNIIVTILISYMLNLIENGKDVIKEKQYIYQNLLVSTILFFLIATFGSIALWNFAESMMAAIVS